MDSWSLWILFIWPRVGGQSPKCSSSSKFGIHFDKITQQQDWCVGRGCDMQWQGPFPVHSPAPFWMRCQILPPLRRDPNSGIGADPSLPDCPVYLEILDAIDNLSLIPNRPCSEVDGESFRALPRPLSNACFLRLLFVLQRWLRLQRILPFWNSFCVDGPFLPRKFVAGSRKEYYTELKG